MLETSKKAFLARTTSCFALIGPSGALKTELASRLALGRSEIAVSTLIWQDDLHVTLSNFLRERMERDPAIQHWLATGSFRFQSRPTTSLAMAADFMGWLGRPDLGALPMDVFRQRQATYRTAVRATMGGLSSVIAEQRKPHPVITTTSSLCDVIKWDNPEDDKVLKWLQANCFAINVTPTEEQWEAIRREGYAHDRPDYYPDAFLDEHVPKVLAELGATDVCECHPDEIMGLLYERLVAQRPERNLELVRKIGGVTVPAAVLAGLNRDQIRDVLGDYIEFWRESRRNWEEDVA
jgi:hypothetical protein